MKFSDLMGEPDSEPQVGDPQVAQQAVDAHGSEPVTAGTGGEPGFAQLNVTEPAPATPADAASEADRLDGLETIDDDLLPRAPRRGRK